MKTKVVDLTMLKRLMSELEASLETANSIKTDVSSDKIEYIVELNKATGLAAGIMTESGLLMGDIQSLMQTSQLPQPKNDLIEKILDGLKGPGNAN